jgi:hypothetical protein
VRRPYVWKIREQIMVGSYPVRGHFSIGKNGQEVIQHIVGKGPTVVRMGRRLCRVKAQEVRQESTCHSPTELIQRIGCEEIQMVGS